MISVILDTNLWISYLISKRLSRLDELFDREDVRLILSEELLTEFIDVAKRPKFRSYFPTEAIDELLGLLDEIADLIVVTSTVTACRDPKDNFLLALAKDGAAQYLVTGDDDLLSLGSFDGTEILRYSEFEEQLRSDG